MTIQEEVNALKRWRNDEYPEPGKSIRELPDTPLVIKDAMQLADSAVVLHTAGNNYISILGAVVAAVEKGAHHSGKKYNEYSLSDISGSLAAEAKELQDTVVSGGGTQQP